MAKKLPKDMKVNLPTSEEAQKPKERTIEEVHKEYSALCSQVGHLDYQIFTHQKDINAMRDAMRNLNFEGAQLRTKLQAEAAKVASEQESKRKSEENKDA